jgi:carbon-monoxide dehydrogenase medium subunit
MKPVAFEYARPGSVREACALLAEDADARILAGGQTLIPLLAMRLARPSLLVDIARIPELSGIEDAGSHLAIGAATRQAVAERDALVASKAPLLAKALPWVGHAPTRNRGTIGGSIANGDPAAEIPLVAVTLEATLIVATAGATSELAASGLYLGPMITALPEGGLLTGVRFPVWAEGRIGTGFHEVSARNGDFALVAAAAQVALDAEGRCTALCVGIGGAAETPVRLDGVSEALIGSPLEEAAVRAALEAATAGLEPTADLHASAAYRRRVAAALARRAIVDARDEAAGGRHARLAGGQDAGLAGGRHAGLAGGQHAG